MIITIVLSLIFTVRSVFNLLFILGLIPRFFPSNYMNPVFWDSLFQLLFEFVPIAIILVVQFKLGKKLNEFKSKQNVSSTIIDEESHHY